MSTIGLLMLEHALVERQYSLLKCLLVGGGGGGGSKGSGGSGCWRPIEGKKKIMIKYQNSGKVRDKSVKLLSFNRQAGCCPKCY